MKIVLEFPATTTMTPVQALSSALALAEDGGLDDVLVVGYSESGGLVVRSSRMTGQDALWMAEMLKRHALGEDCD